MALPRFYFYVLPNEKLAYQHNVIGIAQGLKELGIPFSANNDYWKEANGEFLFKADPDADPRDFDVVVISEQYMGYGDKKIPERFFECKGKKVWINTADGMVLHKTMRRPYFKKFDLILAFGYEGLPYPENIKPWAYGMTQHMIDLSRPDLQKEDKICLNYRNSHSVRMRANEWLFSKLDASRIDTTRESFDWSGLENAEDYAEFVVWQSAGRHNAGYLERIGRSAATSAFGGDFYIKPWFWGWYSWKFINYFVDSAASIGRMNHLAQKIGTHTQHTYRVYQWDSWRIWEAFAAKSMAINVDFEKYRIVLPDMPQNFKHYLGVDLKQPEKALKVLNNLEQMVEIGAGGYEWALNHYAPKPIAQRLLKYLGY